MLIEPVQRLPRYPLLIKALLKYTPEDHQDYNLLLKADKELSDIAKIVDSAIESVEKMDKMIEFQNIFPTLVIVEPHRSLTFQAEVMISPKENTWMKKKSVFILFNDRLLLATKLNDTKFTDLKYPKFPREVNIMASDNEMIFYMSLTNPVGDFVIETKSEEDKSKFYKLVESMKK